jgi:hypothetical protein
MLNPTFFSKRFHQHFCENVAQHFLKMFQQFLVQQNFQHFFSSSSTSTSTSGGSPSAGRGSAQHSGAGAALWWQRHRPTRPRAGQAHDNVGSEPPPRR